ncbi:hypothetical protein BSPWISOXPB_4317 [uncultured Gammaproteobacteria bacterium]|nr:hypothetical protein BSPWISOXPB_4317 [uncultured Gammaproteobacteria bacterium]
MIEFIIILLVSIGLSVSEAGSTVLGGQVYDEVGECHIAGTRFKTPCKNKKPAEICWAVTDMMSMATALWQAFAENPVC